MSIDCPVQHACGGCPLMGLPRNHQRSAKVSRVADALGTAVEGIGWTPSPRDDYRRRIRIAVTAQHATFFNRNKAADCVVLSPGLHQVLEWTRARPWPGAAHLEAREPDLDGLGVVIVTPLPTSSPDSATIPPWWLQPPDTYRHGSIRIAVCARQAPTLQRVAIADGIWAYAPASGFMQVNLAVNAHLVAHIVAGAQLRQCTAFVDLFSGSGNHSLPLAATSLPGWASDSDAQSIAALKLAAREQGLALWSGAGSADLMGPIAFKTLADGKADPTNVLAILNPPRAGLRRRHVEVVHRADALVLITCTDAGLIRSQRWLREAGFELEGAHVFDMFAHTEHAETVSWWARRPRGAASIER